MQMRNNVFKHSISGIFLIIYLSPVFAETVEDLGDIIVSATRWETPGVPTAGSITVITRKEIIESGVMRIIDVLRGRGGVQISDLYGDGSRARVDMRGFGSTGGFNTLILVDGRRLNNTDQHDPDLNFISIRDVERIEIIQGSAAVLYGDQAVGGVINIITQQPAKFEADIQAAYGSYDRQTQTINLANQFENGIGVRVSAERALADNYRDNNNLKYINGLFRLTYDWDRGNLFASIQRTDEELGIPGDLFIPQLKISRTQTDTPLDFNDTTSEVFNGGGAYSLSPHWDIAAEYTLRNEDVESVVSLFGVPFSLDQKRLNKSFNPRLRGRFPFNGRELFIIAGADIENIDYSLVSPFGVTDSTQDMKSLYFLGTIPVDDVIDLTGGLRKTWVENDITDTFAAPADTTIKDGQAVSTFGITIKPSDNTRLFLKREDNFRFPLIDEQTSVVGFQPPLETQTGVSYEAGIEWNNQWIISKLVGYRLNLENELIFNPVTFLNSNLDPTKRTGIIFELGITPMDNISIDTQYTYTDARFDGGTFNGNRIPLVSEHQFHLGLTYRFMPYWSLYGEGLFLSNKVAGNDFAGLFPDVPGYGIGNIHLRFDYQQFNVSAGINNVLDKEYRETGSVNFGQTGYFPAPERNYLITLGYTFH